MHEQQRERAQDLLRARRIEYALFANPASITWLTGFAPPIQQGPPAFTGGPHLLWYAGGEWSLIVFDGQADLAATESCLPVHSYKGYTIEEPIQSARNLAQKLREVAGNAQHIGVEVEALPFFLRESLRPDANIEPLDGALAPLRMIKTTDELVKLRASFALADVGQAAAQAAVRAGNSELDVWSAMQTAIFRAAERRVPMGNDCTIGRRAHIGGWPLNERIVPGDSFVVDLSTRLYGYWSDSCATYYAGTPSPSQVALHKTVAEALDLAISLVRPGAVACEIDQQVRDFMRASGYPLYAHHTGHGVGVTQHEEPRIVPYNKLKLEPGMVVMVEPGVYLPDKAGIRLEHALLVTSTGAEVLTKHSTAIDS